jgi:NADH dehydrogenase
MHRVVIVGGGFAGIEAAKALRRAPVELTVLDRRNYHLFQPLLYQVATGGLSPGDIAQPIRAILAGQRNTQVLLQEVADFDLSAREVHCSGGTRVPYDTLIVAAGARHHYFGNEQWERHAPGLKTIEDATAIRARLLAAFERAEAEPDAALRREWLTFVIVGAGPTGAELSGALAEIARDTMRRDFHRIRPEEAQILLLDAGQRVLAAYTEPLSQRAMHDLIALGVRPLLGCTVSEVNSGGVRWRQGGEEHWLPARTVIWAAGVQASPLATRLAEQTGIALDHAGRMPVQPDLTLAGHPEIFVLGDMARKEQDGQLLPGMCPVAMQQGRYVAALIGDRLAGRPGRPFRYVNKGVMATIGRHAAVAMVGPFHFGGVVAWLAWLFLHILYIVGFANRVIVMIRWAVNYATFHRGARLITHEVDTMNE